MKVRVTFGHRCAIDTMKVSPLGHYSIVDNRDNPQYSHKHMSYQAQIEEALAGSTADYSEIRIEESDSTRLTYRGRSLDDVNMTSGKGGAVRVCVNGSWGFASFNELSDLKSRVRDAVDQARSLASSNKGESTMLAEVEPHVDIVDPVIVKDPREITLQEKTKLADHYNEIVWSQPGIVSSDIVYGDSSQKIAFGNSDGTYVEQERVHVISRISAQAREGSDVQQAGFSIGALGDYSVFEGLDDEVTEAAKRAVDLLEAKPLTGGQRTVILDPILAGVFVHEAFGHLSEADNVYENDKLKELMYLGRKFGGTHLNFTDGAGQPGMRGSYKYDDEGTSASLTPLVRDGVLVGRLHSRETAAKTGEAPTGNARAINYRFPPIVRMTNTFIENGEATFDDLFEGVEDGVYVKNWYGGMTQHEMFTFSSGEAYMIRNGEIQEAVRPVMLSGNLFETLENVDAVANDRGFNQGGGCGKGGQMPLPVGTGSPHIRIRNCLISGA